MLKNGWAGHCEKMHSHVLLYYVKVLSIKESHLLYSYVIGHLSFLFFLPFLPHFFCLFLSFSFSLISYYSNIHDFGITQILRLNFLSNFALYLPEQLWILHFTLQRQSVVIKRKYPAFCSIVSLSKLSWPFWQNIGHIPMVPNVIRILLRKKKITSFKSFFV